MSGEPLNFNLSIWSLSKILNLQKPYTWKIKSYLMIEWKVIRICNITLFLIQKLIKKNVIMKLFFHMCNSHITYKWFEITKLGKILIIFLYVQFYFFNVNFYLHFCVEWQLNHIEINMFLYWTSLYMVNGLSIR